MSTLSYCNNFLENYLKRQPDNPSKSTIASLAVLDFLEEQNPQVAQAILQELKDQRSYLKMIASENYSSLSVQLAMGNWLTDKYAEGFVGRRFYAGCANVDTLEQRANDYLKKIFGAEHAYCQPHSGADANLVAYWSILVQRVQNKEVERLQAKSLEELSIEDRESIRKLLMSQKIMGLSLDAGGHLTHGFLHNLSSKMMQSFSYGVSEKTFRLDYEEIAKQVKQVKPLILVAGYSAYPRRINFAKMREIADSVGAVLMVDMAHFAGLVAGGVMTGEENPIPYADIVTSTSHKTLRGPRGGFILCKQEFQEIVDKGCPLVLGGPLPHVMAAKAVAFEEASKESFREYAHQIVANAKTLAEELKLKGANLLTDGTDNHLIVVNTTNFGLSGKQAEEALRQAGMTLNRNTVPFDPLAPWISSGIRLGTAALTTLGMKEAEMKEVAGFITKVLSNTSALDNPKTGKPSKVKARVKDGVAQEVKTEVEALLARYPLYPEIEIDNIG
ncbi:MAG: glycine hydroxymethyltransferase [Chlamydiales bacterium]|nr:glycine hydroxymethyltransferase [Chlamydiales bacterium]NCF70231.1 glycine hydroxymethyltransferase [Chlamydiales bacterium]